MRLIVDLERLLKMVQQSILPALVWYVVTYLMLRHVHEGRVELLDLKQAG